MKLKFLVTSLAAIFSIMLVGCELGYYSQLATGQLEILSKRKPIQALLEDHSIEPHLKERLILTNQALTFAETRLLINVKDRYKTYVELKRPYVVWTLSATPELSLKPYQWCYPIVGCANYRGFFDRDKALAAEKKLQAQGYETYLRGVTAYSTLGWFEDPVLSTFSGYSEQEYLTLIFHELAHSKFYIKNNTRFNESFATFVGQQAYNEFKTQNHLAEPKIDQERQVAYTQLKTLLMTYKKKFRNLYQSTRTTKEKKLEKNNLKLKLFEDYGILKKEWQHTEFDQWMRSINNARLMVYSDYESMVPEFEDYFSQCNQNWECFYQKVKTVGANR